MNKTIPAPSISHKAALALAEASRKAAKELGIDITVAVTDSGGHLKAFERADTAPFLTVDVAINKAWTAASFGLPTHVWSKLLQDDAIAHLGHQPRMMAVGGGYPVKDGEQLVGGLGISGGSAQQDQQIAVAALRAVGFSAPE